MQGSGPVYDPYVIIISFVVVAIGYGIYNIYSYAKGTNNQNNQNDQNNTNPQGMPGHIVNFIANNWILAFVIAVIIVICFFGNFIANRYTPSA
jgi:Na+/H+-dicarboxylate symporter